MKPFANLVEIFTSIQGEGLYVGRRQLFLRFAKCNLKCVYCDTKDSWEPPQYFRFEKTPCKRDFISVANLISSESLVEMLESQFSEPIHSVCLTGGEPLCQADFLKEFIPLLKSHGLTVFLETNGTLPHELEKVVDTIDIIAADIKLPSISKQVIDFSKVEEFLKLAWRKKVFVKIVVSNLIDIKEFNEAIDLIHLVNADIHLVIQPISAKEKAAGAALLSLQEQALKKLKNVFIIPQIHKILGLR